MADDGSGVGESADEFRPVHAALDKSGFPLQTAIAAEVKRVPGWSVPVQEFAWTDAAGEDQFLDVVGIKDRWCVTIECKKTEKEFYTFLRPDEDSAEKTSEARVLYTVRIMDSTGRLETLCGEGSVMPDSYQAALCVVGADVKGHNQRLIERDARLLVHGTDAFALDRQERLKDDNLRGKVPLPLVYVPVLVTNAKLFSARYAAKQVSLETARFSDPATVEAVRWIRLRKSFGPAFGRHDLGERTVFVVQAFALREFLSHLSATDPSEQGRAWVPGRTQ